MATDRPRSPRSWAARARRSASRRRAFCSRRLTGTARTSSAARAPRAASEARRASRRASRRADAEADGGRNETPDRARRRQRPAGHDRCRWGPDCRPRRSSFARSTSTSCSGATSLRAAAAGSSRRSNRRRGDDVCCLVTPPHFRAPTVTRPVDLIEEVARIRRPRPPPATLPPRNGRNRSPHARQGLRAAWRMRWAPAACRRSPAGASRTPPFSHACASRQ